MQPSLLYHPRRYSESELTGMESQVKKAGHSLHVVEYALSTGDKQIAFLSTPTSGSPRRLCIFFGGNAMTAIEGLEWLLQVHQRLLQEQLKTTAFLAVDYPGYGLSEGEASPDRIHESVEKALSMSLGILVSTSLEVDIVGHSLGSAVAARYTLALLSATKSTPNTARVVIRNLVMSAPFTSISAMASHIFGLPNLLSRAITRHEWNSETTLKSLISLTHFKGKVTVVHGHNDGIVPYTMGQTLSSIDTRISLVSVPRAGHNDLLGYIAHYAKILQD